MSWLPFSLPAFALPVPSVPTNIQHRLISFVLKKFLGRFLKPGSFDESQIDSQIGNGSIDVHGLILDDNALNEHLLGTPFALCSGSIGKVTANLPWPNVFTAPISLSLSSLHLTLSVKPDILSEPFASPDLTDSVSSVVETFLKDELSAKEEEQLDDAGSIPGSFQHARSTPSDLPDDETASRTSTVSSFLENLLARFTFLVTDMKLTVIALDGSELVVNIPQIAYSTEGEGIWTARIIKITGLNVVIRLLKPVFTSSPTPSTSSSMDEDIVMKMTQSLIGLPEAELDESIYQSIASQPDIHAEKSTFDEKLIMSLESRPILISIKVTSHNPERLSISLETGVVPCAVTSYHLGFLVGLLASTTRSPRSVTSTPSSGPIGPIDVSIKVRGVDVFAFLPETSTGAWRSNIEPYLTRPASVTPRLPCVHLYIRTIHLLLLPERLEDGTSKHIPHYPLNPLRLSADITELALMTGRFVDNKDGGDWISIPIIILDPYLTQDSLTSPTNPSGDWRQGISNFKPSHWYTRSSSRSSLSKRETIPSVTPSGCTITGVIFDASSLVVKVLPLQLFLDLANLETLLEFAKQVQMAGTHLQGEVQDRESRDDDTPPASLSPEQWVRGARSASCESSSASNDAENTARSFTLGFQCPGIRIQIRCPSPSTRSMDQPIPVLRSGALLINFENFCTQIVEETSSADQGASTLPVKMVKVSWNGAFLLISRETEYIARTFLSILNGPNSSSPESHVATSEEDKPSVSIFLRSSPHISLQPYAIHLSLSKANFDAVQYFIDDLSKFFVDASTPSPNSSLFSVQSHRILGSRYFVGSRQQSLWNTTQLQREEAKFKLTISIVRLYLGLSATTQELSADVYSDILINGLALNSTLQVNQNGCTLVTANVQDISCSISKPESNLKVDLLAPSSYSHPHSRSCPMVEIRYISYPLPTSTAKESTIKILFRRGTISSHYEEATVQTWICFFKPPPGTFDSVPPSETTHIACELHDVMLQFKRDTRTGVMAAYGSEGSFDLILTSSAPKIVLQSSWKYCSILFMPDAADITTIGDAKSNTPIENLKSVGFAVLAEMTDLDLEIHQIPAMSRQEVIVNRLLLSIHLCADTLAPLSAFLASDPKATLGDIVAPQIPPRTSAIRSDLISSLDEEAFRKVPALGLEPDFIGDDLPTNLDYLDTSFGAAAGIWELKDDNSEGFDQMSIGTEAIRVLDPDGIHVIDNYFETLPPEESQATTDYGETSLAVRIRSCDVALKLYSGYDWSRTRKMLEDQQRVIRKRLAKIRQLIATGQTLEQQDIHTESTRTLLFNSVYVGLEGDIDELDPTELMTAIDTELNHDANDKLDLSWQTIVQDNAKKPEWKQQPRRPSHSRSSEPCIEFLLSHLTAEVDTYIPKQALHSRVLLTSRDLEILDHMKTSTWERFLTEMRSDSNGNVRESGSDMVRVELLTIQSMQEGLGNEARLRAKFLPLRLHVDQDALDFLKAFFAFHYPDDSSPQAGGTTQDTYFQHVEIFPVHIKLDYKPKRVDYRALKEGRTIELMNFFHFDGAEMTLRHITLSGITGWPKLFDTLNDLWTPDVKANQLSDIISGVSPIRSLVNVGTGVADLVLLPIAEYQKDRRFMKGVQKGAHSFVKSTGLETIKLGARLATGTQVILEQAETVLGGQFKDSVVTETLSSPLSGHSSDVFSRYADQPEGVTDGLRTAYKSLSKNLNLAGQTILALPMEVHERSGSEGAMRTVVRAVPIALLKPMIGASEAVSKTLLGLRNTIDPERREDDESKYKHR